MYPVKQSTALDFIFFAFDANGDGVTGKVDGNWTKRISKYGAAFAAMTVTVTERENGFYHAQLSTSHTDTLGVLTISFSASGVKQVNLQFRVSTRIPDDHAFPNVSGRGMDVDASGGVEVGSFQTGAIGASAFSAGAIDAAAIADNAIDTATFAPGTAVPSNVTQISGDATAADNLESACDGTGFNVGAGQIVSASVTGAVGSVTAMVSANITQISSDATAADNLEAAFDGTGFNVGAGQIVAASVTGAVGSVTGSVGSVTGSVGSLASVANVFTTQMTEAYRATGVAGSLAQMIFEIHANITDFVIAGTTKTVRKLDGTTAKTYTLDSSTAPTSITEAS